MLRALADLGEFELVDPVLEEVVQGKGEAALEGRGGAQAGAQGHVAREDRIEAVHLPAALDGLAADAEDVTRPGL